MPKPNEVPEPISFDSALIALERAHYAEKIVPGEEAIKRIERERIIDVLDTLGIFNLENLRELLTK